MSPRSPIAAVAVAGDLAFPIQAAILLSQPGSEFTGSEFCPDRTASASAEPLRQGDAVAFAVHNRWCRAPRAITA